MVRIELEPFLEGFLEKIAFFQVVPPKAILKRLDENDLSQGEREDISLQLRSRDWDRFLRGVALTAGGAALGGLAGGAVGSLIPSETYNGKPLWMQTLPAGIGAGLGGWMGRNLEMAVLDPSDRLYYRAPERLRERLERSKTPLLAPAASLVPEIV